LITDIIMTIEYWNTGRIEYALGTLAMVVTTIMAQILICVVFKEKTKFRDISFDVVVTIFGLKPVSDALKISTGAKQQAGQLIDPLSELTYTKNAELVFESIPGTCLQLSALLVSKETSAVAIISILGETGRRQRAKASSAESCLTLFYTIRLR